MVRMTHSFYKELDEFQNLGSKQLDVLVTCLPPLIQKAKSLKGANYLAALGLRINFIGFTPSDAKWFCELCDKETRYAMLGTSNLADYFAARWRLLDMEMKDYVKKNTTYTANQIWKIIFQDCSIDSFDQLESIELFLNP